MRKLIDHSPAQDHKIVYKNRKINGNIDRRRDATNTQQRELGKRYSVRQQLQLGYKVSLT